MEQQQPAAAGTSAPKGRDVNLEVFINKKLLEIYNQATDQPQLRTQCKDLIDALTGSEFGKSGTRANLPLPPNLTIQLLNVLKAALTSNQAKFAEPALACLHKLVAYAYISGETRISGRLDDDGIVTQVVVMTTKIGDNPSPTVQLHVLKALLTFVTAEHFLPHGDCLMQAIRTTFNVAVGGATPDLRNTARSALLQMLNTVLKRVVQQIMTPAGTPLMLTPQQTFNYPKRDNSAEKALNTLGISGAPLVNAAAAKLSSSSTTITPSNSNSSLSGGTKPQHQQTESLNTNTTTGIEGITLSAAAAGYHTPPANVKTQGPFFDHPQQLASGEKEKTGASTIIDSLVGGVRKYSRSSTLDSEAFKEEFSPAEAAIDAALDDEHINEKSSTTSAIGSGGGMSQSGGVTLGTRTSSGSGVLPSQVSAALEPISENPANKQQGKEAGSEAANNDNDTQEQPVSPSAENFARLQSRLAPINTPTSGNGGPGSANELSPATQEAQQAAQQRFDEERTARLASLADQGDLRGLERALGDIQSDPSGKASLGSLSFGGIGAIASSSLTGTERDLGTSSSSVGGGQQKQQQGGLSSSAPNSTEKPQQRHALVRTETPPDPRRALMRERRAAEWRALTVAEKDAALVLGAICKMAARETGIGASESYMHAGKLLALDFLVKVLSNPMHDWSAVRPEFATQLRQPLCLVMLRNCSVPYEQAMSAAVEVLKVVLQAQRLRACLKVEVGALYPLMLLRPLEGEKTESVYAAQKAVEGLLSVCSSPQVLADIYVNYDCSLQAANLFERSMKVLARACRAGLPGGGVNIPAAPAAAMRASALQAMIAAVRSLDAWAGPLKEAAAAASATLEEETSQHENNHQRESKSPTAKTSLQSDILERIHADKEMKSSLQAGIAAFNSGDPLKALFALAKTGVLSSTTPETAVDFLKNNVELLDPSAVGELLGDHRDEALEIMRVYVQGEDFKGMSLDEALRHLLAQFRLPGEAQKIDRIMEVFAATYCAANPGRFPVADAAYLLSFAIIMLNTDAHNPMAEGRMSSEDFVGMCTYQSESGEFLEILPEADLKELYQRIKDKEIQVRTAPASVSGSSPGNANQNGGAGGQTGSSSGTNNKGGLHGKHSSSNMLGGSRARLAAALGLTQLMGPFWGGNTWDKQYGVDVERRRIADLTKELLSGSQNASSAGVMWHSATHAEHARPMMSVAGNSILVSLSSALQSADTLPAALSILDSFVIAIRLSALLRLDTITEGLVAALATAAGLTNPAGPLSPGEARQVAALSKLISLGTSSEAGSLGSSWSVIFRTLSSLEGLSSALVPGSPVYGASVASTRPFASVEDESAFVGGHLGRLLSRMGLGSSASSENAATGNINLGSSSNSNQQLSAGDRATATTLAGQLGVREAPGMGAVLWAETAGAGPIDKVFAQSAELDGDSVLTFFRALCAISQEELYPMDSSSSGEQQQQQPPRVYLLQRVVECAYLNSGRIRLVWNKIWTVVSQHLVSAACHTDAYVAMYAVDALRQLADKLLCRSELAGFSSQGDALRPLTAVLRSSDSPAVRELAAACIAHAVGAHSRRLGSGWRSVMEALAVAANDTTPAVVTQCLDILQAVTELLYAPNNTGHTLLKECAVVARAVVDNPCPAIEDLGATALYVFQHLARRLAEAINTGSLPKASSSSLGNNSNAAVAITPEKYSSNTAINNENTTTALSSLLGSSSSLYTTPLKPINTSTTNDQSLTAGFSTPNEEEAAVHSMMVLSLWAAILCPLGSIAATDARPRTADTAAAVLFQVLQGQGQCFTADVWQLAFEEVLFPLLSLPVLFQTAATGGDYSSSVNNPMLKKESTSLDEQQQVETTTASSNTAAVSVPTTSVRRHVAARRLTVLVSAEDQDRFLWGMDKKGVRPEGVNRTLRHAEAHFPDLWMLFVDIPDSQPVGMLPSLKLLGTYIASPSERCVTLGIDALLGILRTALPAAGGTAWNTAAEAFEDLLERFGDPVASNWTEESIAQQQGTTTPTTAAVRQRCRVTLLLLRAAHSLLLTDSTATTTGSASKSALPVEARLRFVDAMMGAVNAAATLNSDLSERQYLARALKNNSATAVVADSAGPHSGNINGSHQRYHRGDDDDEDDDEYSDKDYGRKKAIDWDGPLSPALIRQECEGGCLVIDVLLKYSITTTTATASNNSTKEVVVEEGEEERKCRQASIERLVGFCVMVLESAVSSMNSVRTTGTTTSSTSSSIASWEDAVRCPLVETALKALCALPMEAWKPQNAAVFSCTAALVKSRNLGVRRGVREMMQKQLVAQSSAMAASGKGSSSSALKTQF